MSARLIVNADDFGLTEGVNRAIVELFAAGVLTSATLMAGGAAFDDAVKLTRSHPQLGVGCHVVLTDGIPVSPPDAVPSLLGADRRSFRPTLGGFMHALVAGKIREEEIERETTAQIVKLQQSGIEVSHVDTHKHTHIFPAVARPLLKAARTAGVKAVREPFEPQWSMGLPLGNWRRRAIVRSAGLLRRGFEAQAFIRSKQIQTTNGTLAISATGHLDSPTLAAILLALPQSGTFELCCHPGYNDAALGSVKTKLKRHREVERDALLKEIPRALTATYPPKLISFAELGESAH